MKSNSLFVLLLLLATIAGCGGGGGGGSTPKTLISIAVTPVNPSIPVQTNQRFSATGTFSDNTKQDLTSSVTWTSSNSQVATIDVVGIATSVAAGTTTITATSNGISGTTTLTVTSGTLVSLDIQPANPSTPLGTPFQFSATGTFSDTTTQDLTTSATWSSSDTSVATISNATGKATPVAIRDNHYHGHVRKHLEFNEPYGHADRAAKPMYCRSR